MTLPVHALDCSITKSPRFSAMMRELLDAAPCDSTLGITNRVRAAYLLLAEAKINFATGQAGEYLSEANRRVRQAEDILIRHLDQQEA